MHHGTTLTCHCEERSDVAISQYTVGSWGNLRRNRNAFPRLHPKGTSSRFALRAPRRFAPRNDKSEAITILTAAGTDWKCAAGSGMPLPYGGLVKLPAFRFQVSTCRSPAFYFLCFANRNAPMRADRGTARITPTELAMACTISTEKNVPLMSWENDGSSDER